MRRTRRSRAALATSILTPSVRSSASGYGSSTSAVATKPTGTVDGDWVFVGLGWLGGITVTPPAGWTSVRKLGPTVDGSRYMEVFKHKAASDGSTYTFSLSSTKVHSWVAVTVKDADQTDAVDAEAGNLNAVATTVAVPSVVATGTNDLLLVFASITQPDSANTGRINPISSMTELAEVCSVGNGVFNEIDVAADSQASLVAGATGARTATVTTSGTFNNGSLAETIAVKGATGTGVVLTVPGVPTGAAAVQGDTQATVSWSAPASDGGSAITAYRVTATPGGATVTVGAVTTGTVTGLTNGVSYTFTVRATNAVGNGAESSASNPVTPTATVQSGRLSFRKFGACIANRSWYANFPGAWYYTGVKYLLGYEPGIITNRFGNLSDPSMTDDFQAWHDLFPGWTRRGFNGESGVAADTPGWQIQRRVIGVPLAFWTSGYSLADIANGANDAHYLALAQKLSSLGWGNTYVAIGWEAGGDWYPWYWGNNQAATWKTAWLRVRNIFKSVNPLFQCGFATIANTILAGSNTLPGRTGTSTTLQYRGAYPSNLNVTPKVYSWDATWPGDQFVDFVEIDHYDIGTRYANTSAGSGCWPNPQDVWDNEHWILLDLVRQFCAAHNKPLCVGEWGVGDRTGVNPSQWGGDNPNFIQNFAEWIDALPASPGVGYFCYFLTSAEDGEHSPALYTASNPRTAVATLPNSYSKFRELFGV